MDHDGIELQLHKYLNMAYVLTESSPVEIRGRYSNCKGEDPVFVGPCHHGMARPQVADGGTASDMQGSCE